MDHANIEKRIRSRAITRLHLAREAGRLGDFDEVDRHFAKALWWRRIINAAIFHKPKSRV